ncbi:glutamate racemase [Variovorax sp. dw_954]|uniref:glutamate racemase n=1 Tax=Variovorax sp. dw_954 TaxID=2720078 RepID=UPI0021163D85|nr:glutamate racemase [Variovorax sp. dw_954]
MSASPVGVFDSGVGGLSVLNALRAELPHERFVYFADTANAPYGERGEDFVTQRTLAIAVDLVERHRIKALVVACNTATAAAIHLVRATYPDLPVVGLEPALKPAVSLSGTRNIAVLATRGTLDSLKFKKLHASLADQANFSLVPCDGLAAAIESSSNAAIADLCARYMHAAGRFGTEPDQIDTVVLGCTHYPFIADELRRHAGPGVRFIDTGAPVALQTRRLLAAAATLADECDDNIATVLETSGAPQALAAAAARWLLQPAAQPAAAAR